MKTRRRCHPGFGQVLRTSVSSAPSAGGRLHRRVPGCRLWSLVVPTNPARLSRMELFPGYVYKSRHGDEVYRARPSGNSVHCGGRGVSNCPLPVSLADCSHLAKLASGPSFGLGEPAGSGSMPSCEPSAAWGNSFYYFSILLRTRLWRDQQERIE